ncbi:Fimbrial adhesin precursor [Pseudomonas orientalis]|uniref:fimbrial protein n=1 Tax=Pseudomonas orientalis TaxID=76758 RepID=UPI000F55B254|nr:fimbrial protein [Pseudomonas orientalis]AZE97870.1 Fimbrial adhesin precursor [Pseudomonas orientalis]
MKYILTLVSTLLGLGLPIAAQAECDSYPRATTHTLTLPDTIVVPDSLPYGALITQQPFSGTAPGLFIRCANSTKITVTGKYPNKRDPHTGAFLTEVPGVGVKIAITDARGTTNFFALHNQSSYSPAGTWISLTSAVMMFYKIAPVTDGVMTSGDVFAVKWHTTPNMLLRLGNSVRFVRPSATCDLAAGDVNRTITLDPVQVSAFNSSPYAGARDFELTANCSDATNVTFRFSGPPSPENTLLFANTGTAGGVALWLYSRINGTNRTIPANGSDNERTLVVTGNRAVLPLGAAYHKSGTVGQGTLTSTATVNITYN